MSKAKGKGKTPFLRYILRMIPIVWRCEPWRISLDSLVAILHAVSWGVIVVAQQALFDTAAGLAAGTASLDAALYALAWFAAAHMVSQVLNGVGNFYPQQTMKRVTGKLAKLIHAKAARLDPLCYERTESLDDINKAGEGKETAGWTVMIILLIPTFYLPYFLFMGWYLFSLKPLLVLALAVAFVPIMGAQLIRQRFFAKAEDASAPVRRENTHYEDCVAGREFFKETRLLGGFAYFAKQYRRTLAAIQHIKLRAQIGSNLFELGASLVTFAGYGLVLWLLVDALLAGEVTVGAFAAVFAQIGMIFGVFEEVVTRHLGSIAQESGKVGNLVRFLDLPERTGADVPLPERFDITFDHVSFRYPQSEDGKQTARDAVHDVSFTLRDGETIAVVGENGSGKTTLVRLLTGLYLPTSGEVRCGKTPTGGIAPARLFADTSAVFQKYQRYQMTLRENVGVSRADADRSDARLTAVLPEAGVDPADAAYPGGADTMLSREFDGVDLSGGQWQRVALARGFFRDAAAPGNRRLIVLDEPTAAIDPFEETRVYERFAALCRDKTAVIVTHRLGSVRLADRILVLRDGALVEEGVHDDLLQASGEYARLYRAQESWYKENTPESAG